VLQALQAPRGLAGIRISLAIRGDAIDQGGRRTPLRTRCRDGLVAGALVTAHGPSEPTLSRVAESLRADHPQRERIARLDGAAQRAIRRGDLRAAIHALVRNARLLGFMEKPREEP
jgi:hypothetical protein